MRLALIALLPLMAAALPCPTTRGDDAPKPAAATVASSAPEARARFDSLVTTYRALPAYADRGEVAIVTRVGDKTTRQVQKARIAFARPDKLDVETDLVRVLSDGATVTEVNLPLKKFRTTPAPRPFREAMLRGGPLGAVEFGGMAGLPMAHVLNLVIGVEPERLVNDFAPRLVVEPDQTLDGNSYQVLRFDEADNHDWRFLINPKTGLIAHVDLAIEGDAANSSIAGPAVRVESIRWSAGPIATTPPDPAAFAYKPAEGFTAVAPLEAGQTTEELLKKAFDKVGIPTP